MVPEPPIDIIPGFSMSLTTNGEWKYDNYQILDTTTNDAITPDQMLDLLMKNYYHLRDDLWMNTLTIESKLPTNHFEFGFNPKWLKMYTKVYFDHAINVPSMVYQTVVDDVTHCEFERHGKLPTPYMISDWGQTKEGCVRYTKNSTMEDHDFEDIGWITSETAPYISSLLKHPIKFWVKGVEYYDFEATSRTRPYPEFYTTTSFLIDVDYEIYVHKDAVTGEAWSEVKRHLYPRGASGKIHDRTVDIYLEGRRKLNANDFLYWFVSSNTWETEWHYEQKRVSIANTVFTQTNPWIAIASESSNFNEIVRYLEDVPMIQYGTSYSFDMSCWISFGSAAIKAQGYVTLNMTTQKAFFLNMDFVAATNPFEHVIHCFSVNGAFSRDGCYMLYSDDPTMKMAPMGATHKVTFRNDLKNIGSNQDPTSTLFSTCFSYSTLFYVKGGNIDYSTFEPRIWNFEYTDVNRHPHTVELREYIKGDNSNYAYLYLEDTHKVDCKKYVFKKEVNLTLDYGNKAIASIIKAMYANATWEEEGGGSGQITNLQIVRCTEAEYTALATKDPNTLYILN